MEKKTKEDPVVKGAIIYFKNTQELILKRAEEADKDGDKSGWASYKQFEFG